MRAQDVALEIIAFADAKLATLTLSETETVVRELADHFEEQRDNSAEGDVCSSCSAPTYDGHDLCDDCADEEEDD